MVFIVYSQISEERLEKCLGMPEYSYYFVLRGFLPVLRELGEVVVVKAPEKEVDAIYDDCLKCGRTCFFLSFSPPNKTVVGLRCPTVCVFAWEFDRIPDEVWEDNPKHDWRFVLANHGSALTLSQYAVESVRKALGANFPVTAIPVPVYDNFEDFRSRNKISPPAGGETVLTINGNVVDSFNYDITADSFELKVPLDFCELRNWNGETLRLGFAQTDEFCAYLGGFYQPEDWGTWSRIERPWVLIPYRLTGTVHLKISACGYASNANREISVSLGGETESMILGDGYTETQVSFQLKEPDNLLKFSGLDLAPVPKAPDPRTMGLGLRSIEISGAPLPATGSDMDKKNNPIREVSLDGVVFTSVFNPGDDRKNWTDMVKAFCLAFNDVEDATLVLKMTHHSLSSFMGKLHFLLQQMWPFKCRIVALHGYLDGDQYEKLIKATHFYVNASRCEGLCLPLMEYMACGRPAIAPCNTSLTDYIDDSSTLIVKSNVEPGIWPHDPRNIFRALRYRINFESLTDAYRQGYAIVKTKPDVFREMARSAVHKMKAYSSKSAVKKQLREFFEKRVKAKAENPI